MTVSYCNVTSVSPARGSVVQSLDQKHFHVSLPTVSLGDRRASFTVGFQLHAHFPREPLVTPILVRRWVRGSHRAQLAGRRKSRCHDGSLCSAEPGSCLCHPRWASPPRCRPPALLGNIGGSRTGTPGRAASGRGRVAGRSPGGRRERVACAGRRLPCGRTSRGTSRPSGRARLAAFG